MKRYLLVISCCLLPGLLLASACPAGHSLRGENSGKDAVVGDFTLPDLAGHDVRLSDYRGKVVYLSFWATWCEPCRLELPHLQRLWQQRRQQGFELLTICVDPGDRDNLVRQQVRRDGYRFPVLRDRETELIDRFNPTMDLPFGLLLDRQGRIQHIQQGFRLGDEENIRQKIDSLLGR
ncbi:MAG: TlpA family protein disulfide reductase [Deltaproteobacteria bacterium]|nr:MAG: TlpA family protein disulfide reductase [Deltaproteobacteria bacterium]